MYGSVAYKDECRRFSDLHRYRQLAFPTPRRLSTYFEQPFTSFYWEAAIRIASVHPSVFS